MTLSKKYSTQDSNDASYSHSYSYLFENTSHGKKECLKNEYVT